MSKTNTRSPTSSLGRCPAYSMQQSYINLPSLHLQAQLEWLEDLCFAVSDLGFTAAAAVASAVGGLSAAMAAQLVWTPVDVLTQRLMVANGADARYVNGVDMFRKIVRNDGVRGLYMGSGISILTNAPSNAVWWASYSVAQRLVWGGVGCFLRRKYGDREGDMMMIRPDSKTVMAFQGVSAAMAGGLLALITMPLDTIKTNFK
ncbi:solute carrier family 25 member 44-like [Citrus clementina]|uniref:solute carrier family 25 member 44-like n=1 Tax=Citrus clementina TaxID=85681 RepID=UPI000CED3BF1|nr:solute carrier family 25 member 44-like [Citrus x clementina]